jgi:RND family efflux transporter MFP subunit
MLKQALIRYAAIAALMSGTSFCLAAQAPEPSESAPMHRGFTQPSEQRKLNFNVPGVVAKVYVKEGDSVKKGQLVAEQDAREDVAQIASLESKVLSADIEIEAAKQTLEEKNTEQVRKENMLKTHVIGQLEVLEARLDVKIAELREDMSIKEKQGKELDVDAAKAKMSLRKLIATTDGIVQQIGIHEGELASNDPKNAVVTIVTNDPLYVEVDLPVSATKSMKLHQKVHVRYEDEDAWKTAEVVFFNPMANPGARAQHVRLQMDNPEQARSGMNVMVKLDEKMASAQIAR